ncbi:MULTISPECIES: sigma-70 family RNA polymerase sigma factor [unclassified Cupriavidus]|uniref:sigma-70 family RNA polymerase sigma factor n=1 Tax=unclassified Cupriavidus TaxID=2640874 RepID=UPI00136662A2|nr:sigma-70 family RNA polymerase sigma factor [Cupriavidus sp. SW-Y-13]MWL89407.1 sigma-70 family RNA polymerase sigma factor [Cupriavidus sp. SW-Y-13]
MTAIDPGAHSHVESLYGRHHQWLQGWLLRKIGNACDAADLAQDVFVRVLHRKVADIREPRTYLGTIANGLVIDFWRRRELEQAWLETLAHLPEAHAPSPESRLHFLQTLMEIDRMLDTLKPRVRTAFLLAQLDGLTCPQIAEHIGMSLATVERYIGQALRRCYELRFGTE